MDDEECLSKAAKEAATAEAAFVVALRGLLLDSPPEFPGAEAPPGPSGTPPTPQEQAAELDHLETLWAQWLPLAGTAEYHLWQGGTIAPVMSETTVLDLTRRHMEDLADIYDDKLADR